MNRLTRLLDNSTTPQKYTCPLCGGPSISDVHCRACTVAAVLLCMEDAERMIEHGALRHAVARLETSYGLLTRRVREEAGAC